MIEVSNLLYQDNQFELRADFALPDHSITAVLGPSAAGKSTLLHMLSGQLAYQQGKILIDNKDIAKTKLSENPVSLLFQDHNSFEHLTVTDNLALASSGQLKSSNPAIQRVIHRLGLAGFERRKVYQLSGGQQARVALAMVLLQKNKVIALDEPFSALGPALRYEIMQLTLETAREIEASLLIVSHQPEEALLVADYMLWVEDGAVTGPYPREAFLSSPPKGLLRYMGNEGMARLHSLQLLK